MQASSTEKKQILFVDDERSVLDGLRRLLRSQRKEWQMHFAGGVDEALQILTSQPVDAVVSDVNMPVRDGFDLLSSIRSQAAWDGLPVIILTGNGETGLKRKALDLGATDLLNKPVSQDDLLARLRSVLRIKAYEDRIKEQNQELEARVRERTAQLEYSQAELVWRLGKAGEFRDSDTGYHVVRVGFFARQLSEAMGLDGDFTRKLLLTAPLHDIGKIGVPDQILLKPARLTEDEWVIMRRHTTMGAQILRDEIIAGERLHQLGVVAAGTGVLENPLTEMAARVAEGHHERWDGGGYPHGLRGESIPLEARLTSLADVYDALNSRRPYKEPFPLERVEAILREGSGTQFDPAVHDAYLKSRDAFRDIREEFDDERLEDPQADVASVISKLSEAA